MFNDPRFLLVFAKIGAFQNLSIFTARVRCTKGGYVFTGVCLLTQGHLHPIILPTTGPLSLPGGAPVTGPRSCPRGYPSDRTQVLSLGGVSQPPDQDWGIPQAGLGYLLPGQVTLGHVTPWLVRLLRFPAGEFSCDPTTFSQFVFIAVTCCFR